MQLKRDTDYALRILLYIGEQWPYRDASGDGFSVSEISSQTGIPKISANRICGYLEIKDTLSSRKTDDNDALYYPGPAFYRKSLLDVLEATEQGANLFAVFDKKSGLYKKQNRQLKKIQNEVEHVLSSTTIEDFLKKA